MKFLVNCKSIGQLSNVACLESTVSSDFSLRIGQLSTVAKRTLRAGQINSLILLVLSGLIIAAGIAISSISVNENSITRSSAEGARALSYAKSGAQDASQKLSGDVTAQVSPYTLNVLSPADDCPTNLDGCAEVSVLNTKPTLSPRIITVIGHSGAVTRKIQLDLFFDGNYAVTGSTETEIKTLPTVSTVVATNVAETSATFNGVTNPNGNDVEVWFRYSPAQPSSCSDAFGARLPGTADTYIDPAPGDGDEPVYFEYAVSAGILSPGTTYYYCAIGDDGAGNKVYGRLFQFTTTGSAPGTAQGFVPAVVTTPASNAAAESATLNGQASPNGLPTNGWFRYQRGDCVDPCPPVLTCTSDTNGTRVPPSGGVNLGSGGSPIPYSYDLEGLLENTVYRFCAIASNSEGTSLGQVLSFTTTAAIPPFSELVSAGSEHTCGIFSDSILKCWGYNGFGQLGDNSTAQRNTPVAVSGITNATQISAGYRHTCALLSDSTVKCWGNNDLGQLGDNTTTQRLTPVAVSGISNATQISAGYRHTCARLADSTVKCWGYGASGRLGDGGTANQSTPVVATGVQNATQVSAGFDHTCALLSNAVIECWGSNAFGQLGNGTTSSNANLRTLVVGITNAIQISADDRKTCAVLSDNTLNCWGRNTEGQLGNGTTTNSSQPVMVSGIANATQVSHGGSSNSLHTCATLSDSTVKCWGYNSYGQLGDNTSGTNRLTPVQVKGVGGTGFLTDITQVSTGSYHTCAALSDLTLRCWGNGGIGQLGNATSSPSYIPVTVGAPLVVSSAASPVATTTATLNGSANPNGFSSTGYFRYSTTSPGTCNDIFGTRAPSSGGTSLGSGSSAVAYSQDLTGLTGPNTTYYYCAIAQNSQETSFGSVLSFTTASAPSVTTNAATSVGGTTATLQGTINPNGATATGYFRYTTDVTHTTCADTDAFGTRAPSSGGASISVNTSHGRAISGLTVGTTYYFCVIASNSQGTSLGSVFSFTTTTPPPPTVTTRTPTLVSTTTATLKGMANPNGDPTSGWFRYSTTNPGTCNDTFGTRAPSSGGTSLGSGTSTQVYAQSITGLSAGQTYYYCAIAQNSQGTSFGSKISFANLIGTQISPGDSHTCALLFDSTVKCWGLNASGQIGDNSITNRPTPVAVSGISNATSVSSGGDHTCALLSDQTIKCWGSNGSGQLGDNSTTQRLTAVPVSGITNAISVSSSKFLHTCALLSDQTIKCWGRNVSGQLGDNSTTQRNAPVAVSGITSAVQVSSGLAHTCALLSDQTIKCWGANSYGQLGDNSQTQRLTPVAVSGITTAIQISAGGSQTCALLSDFTMKCWGNNDFGQLGDNSTTQRLTPVPVSGITNATQISAGGAGGSSSSTCALLSDQTIKCWGRNVYGQLGDNSQTQRLTPAAVSGITNGAQISTGGDHTCALLSDSGMECWGLNVHGQIGDNDNTTYKLIPVYVIVL